MSHSAPSWMPPPPPPPPLVSSRKSTPYPAPATRTSIQPCCSNSTAYGGASRGRTVPDSPSYCPDPHPPSSSPLPLSLPPSASPAPPHSVLRTPSLLPSRLVVPSILLRPLRRTVLLLWR